MSLRLKLVLWYTGVFGASACVMVLTLHALVAHRLRSELHKLLEDEHEEWARITREHGDDLRGLKRQIHAEIHGERYYPLVYRLHDTAAHRDVLVLASREIETSHQRALLAAAPIRGTPRQHELAALWVGKRPRPFFLLTGPVDLAHRPALTLQVAVYARRTEKRIESLREHLLLALGAFVLFAALSGWFLASRSLKPIDRIVADLGLIESQNLDERLAARPSTACSNGSRPRSSACATSRPTRRTSFAPRWPPSSAASRWPSTGPTTRATPATLSATPSSRPPS